VDRSVIFDARVARTARALVAPMHGLDLIYSNTLINGRVLRALRTLRRPVVSHAHELRTTLDDLTSSSDLATTLSRSSAFIACSGAVATMLTQDLAVPSAKVRLVYSFVDTASIVPRGTPPTLRSELGIDDRTVLVGASGTLDARKGADLFLPLASRVRELSSDSDVDTAFVWIGGTVADVADHREQAVTAGASEHVFFLGERQDAPEIFSSLDVLCLPSREDPYPLVMLESACFGVPTVAFSDSGGAAEFIEDDAGILVPLLDVEAMARALVGLAGDPELRSTMGDVARRKVRERHDLAVAGRQVFEIIDALAQPDRP
jgi:glycosyltransferase involved in cell wall biosynthesis